MLLSFKLLEAILVNSIVYYLALPRADEPPSPVLCV